MATKTIALHEDFFKIGGKRKKRTLSVSEKNPIKIKPNDSIKKTLRQNKINRNILSKLRTIQEQVKNNYTTEQKKEVAEYLDKTDTQNEFLQAMEDLTRLQHEEEEKNANLKKEEATYTPITTNTNTSVATYTLPLPNHSNKTVRNTSILPAPPFGVLKGGSKPTYRMYHNKTLRRPHSQEVFNSTSHLSENTLAKENILSGKLASVAQSFSENTQLQQHKNMIVGGKVTPQKQKRVIRRKFEIGKSVKNRKVCVLVSNKTIRNKAIEKKQASLQTPLSEIRKTLIKKGLIKIGSTTPNDVLYKMYETVSMICGDLQNHNATTLLHNFVHGGL